MAKDFYEILGIAKTASKDEIKRAYRKLAQEHHPDRGGGNAEKFREVNEAYEALSDDAKRQQYDRYGRTFEQASRSGQGFGGGFSNAQDFSDFMGGFGANFNAGQTGDFDFGDIFSDIFGGARRRAPREQGVDLEMTITVDFLESVFGAEKIVTLEKKDKCERCEGGGAESGSKVITCPRCHGQGQIISRQQTILGSIQRAEVCDQCEGTGKIPEKACSECRGFGVKKRSKEVKIAIPAGIDDGQRIKLSGEGEVGYRGSKSGDLYVVVRVRPHPEFKRASYDIYSDVPVSFYQAALGARVEVNTVDGKVMLKISGGTQSGAVLRLRGKGVPHLQSGKRGDHFVTVRVVTPKKLTRREKELFRELAQEKGESVDVEGFWEKIKDNL